MKKIIIILLLLIFVVLPGVIIFLIYPGSSFNSLSTEPAAVPQEPLSDFKTLRIHETWIRNRMLSAVKSNLPEEGFSLQGISFESRRTGIRTAVGVRVEVPVIGSFPLMVQLRLPVRYEEQLRIGLEDLKVGRLPVPRIVLQQVLKRTNRDIDFNSLPLPLPYHVDLDNIALFLDIDPFLDSLLPGARAVDVSTADEYLLIGLALPEEFTSSIESLAADFAEHRTGLVKAAAAALPEEKREVAQGIEKMLSEAVSFSSEDSGQVGALVSYCEGDVEAGISEDDFHWVEFGEKISEGTTIRTGKSSYAELILPGESILKMDESTVLVLEHAKTSGDSQQNRIKQLSGAVRSRVSKLQGDDSWYEIRVRSAVMGVRGTDFSTFADKKNEFRIAVLEGEVLVDADESEAVMLKSEETVTVASGKAGKKEALSKEARKEIEEDLGIRTSEEDIRYLTRRQFSTFIMPQLLHYSELWESLSVDEKWDLQYALEDYMEANPRLARQVDTFFAENNLEEKRRDIEEMFR